MRTILLSSLGVALLLAAAGCKSNTSGSGDSMGGMKMDGDKPTSKPPATMPSTMPM
jgi:hypothetical protein